MPAVDDLQSVATLCGDAADAATTRLIGLGARPSDPTAAAAWDHQDTILKSNISVLNNLSSTVSALIVSEALDTVWPNLQDLTTVTADAEASIAAIADISNAMVKIAAVIDFGVAVAALAAQPSVAGAQGVVTAFNNMVS